MQSFWKEWFMCIRYLLQEKFLRKARATCRSLNSKSDGAQKWPSLYVHRGIEFVIQGLQTGNTEYTVSHYALSQDWDDMSHDPFLH